MFSLRKHLHIWKVALGWLPYLVIILLAIFDSNLLNAKVEWAIIGAVAPMVQRVIIDLTEREWEIITDKPNEKTDNEWNKEK